jgi:hypothetical protein
MIRTLVAVAAVLACAGCAGSSSDEGSSSESTAKTSQAPAVAAATGPQISGTGYTYNVPEGWDRPEQDIPGLDLDSLAAALGDDDGFTDNVNVILSPAGELSAEDAEAGAEDELTAAGATDVTVNDRASVAGSDVAHVTSGMSSNGNDYTIEQFVPSNDGQAFVVTFSFSPSLTAQERAAVTDATLASWTWTD